MKTSKEGNSKRKTPIWKAEVGKHVNIAMSGDLSFLLRMDKEQNKGKIPLALATGRGKLNKQNSSKGENTSSEELRNNHFLDKMKILFAATFAFHIVPHCWIATCM